MFRLFKSKCSAAPTSVLPSPYSSTCILKHIPLALPRYCPKEFTMTLWGNPGATAPVYNGAACYVPKLLWPRDSVGIGLGLRGSKLGGTCPCIHNARELCTYGRPKTGYGQQLLDTPARSMEEESPVQVTSMNAEKGQARPY